MTRGLSAEARHSRYDVVQRLVAFFSQICHFLLVVSVNSVAATLGHLVSTNVVVEMQKLVSKLHKADSQIQLNKILLLAAAVHRHDKLLENVKQCVFFQVCCLCNRLVVNFVQFGCVKRGRDA